MPKCLELQNLFAEYLVSKSERIADKIEDQYRNRLSIYKNNFLLNGEETLAQIFPVVRMLFGVSRFFEVSKNYVESLPATLPNREEWGDEFPAFLAESLAQRQIGYVFDLAQLELYLFQAVRARAARPMKLSDLEGASAANPHFDLIPGLALLKSEFPVDELYESHVSGRIHEVENFEVKPEPRRLVIFQKDGSAVYVAIENDTFEFIQFLRAHGWNETELAKFGADNLIRHLRRCLDLGIITHG